MSAKIFSNTTYSDSAKGTRIVRNDRQDWTRTTPNSGYRKLLDYRRMAPICRL